MKEIPVADAPDQRFSAILNNRRVTFRLWFNSTSDRWSMDLSIDDQPVLRGRKVVLDVNLLQPFDFGIGAIFASANGTDVEPGRAELPAGTVKLYHATDAEIGSVS